MRLFLAINFPAAVRSAVHEVTAPLREAAPELGWIAPEQLHLTVKFLGEQPERLVEALVARLREVAGRHRALPVTLGGVGAFPSFRRARVVWLGLDQSPRLELLHHDVEATCAELGLPLEARAFRPHVTLGRVRTGVAEETLRRLASRARRITFQDEVYVESVDLMQSQLTPAGARYTVLESAALRDD